LDGQFRGEKEIFNNKATVSLNISDIFNSGTFRIKIEDPRFSQDRIFKRETRIATLSFTYRFGGFQERTPARQERQDFGEDADF